MTNRRQFLGLGLAASVWPVVGSARARAAGAMPGTDGARLYKVICHRRFAAAAEFAAPLRAQGVPVHEIDGDVTSVWYHDLALRWAEAPVAIAGFTTPEALFCLERLAWDHRMRVVFRAGPVSAPGGSVVRRVAAPPQVVLNGAGRARARVGDLAEAAAQSAVQAALVPPARVVVNAPAHHGDVAGAWVAWAISPVRRS